MSRSQAQRKTTMKIATYNLRCGGKANQRVHWAQLFEVANPDIFLVQETCSPEQYMASRFWEAHQQQVQWAKWEIMHGAVLCSCDQESSAAFPYRTLRDVSWVWKWRASLGQRTRDESSESSASMRLHPINPQSIECSTGLEVFPMTVI